jgi:hypothetical protein
MNVAARRFLRRRVLVFVVRKCLVLKIRVNGEQEAQKGSSAQCSPSSVQLILVQTSGARVATWRQPSCFPQR